MKHHLPLSVSTILMACLVYSTMNALFKWHVDALPPLPVIVFMQSLVALVLLMPYIYRNGSAEAKKIMKSQRVGMHVLRAVFSLSINFLLFYSIKFIPLVNALLLSNSAPLIVPFVGYLFFSESINHRLWLPVLIGYAGVIIVLNPNAHLFEGAALYAFASAIALAFVIQIVRQQTATESITTITFNFLVFTTLISGLIAIPFWQPLSAHQLSIMIQIGVLYFISQYLANAAMNFGNPQLISSLMYSNVVFAAIISYFAWNVLPSTGTIIGTILIIIGSVACIRIEHMTVKRAIQVEAARHTS